MKLEILQALPAAPSDKPPLLFLHGAYAGAWMWAEHFLSCMADRGYAAYAVSFRGHGRSAGRESLWRHTLADYLEDAGTAIRAIGRAPVLIGHSLGGLVAQRCLAREAVAGLVLMAAVPPEGLMPLHAQIALHDPALWLELVRLTTLGSRPPAPAPARLGRVLFSDGLSRRVTDAYMSRMQEESWCVLTEAQFPASCERAARFRLPALVIGREEDRLIPFATQQRTARHHGAEIGRLPGSAHLMMLEARWQETADLLTGWLGRTYS